jgi:protein-S-isoprenylcysteine O-methyltransferase Ste14
MNYLALAAGTILIILFSWFLSIKHKRYHGIARFFSFESIFVLILLNEKEWFKDAFAIKQVISWIFLFFSFYIAVAGYVTLKKLGKPDKNFENTSVLVRKGLYKYIRHPLYFSLFLLGTGIMLKDTRTTQLIAGFINLIAVYITARIEEGEMISRFGNDYREYMKETKMFIPYIL